MTLRTVHPRRCQAPPRPAVLATAARLCTMGAALLAWPLAALPAAVTDGSVGAVQSLSGHFTVPQSLGTVRGANLFHSFARFGVGATESATFSTTDTGLRHVISRVTGGEASLIDGTLRLDAAAGSRPSFWFINPSGITIGAGAVIDVPASLHLSTAAQLRFGDGVVWDARDGRGSTLSIAAPERFGFVGDQAPAALQWQGAHLTLQPGSTLTLAGGEVVVEQATLFTPGGNIRVHSPGDVLLVGGARLQATAGVEMSTGGIHIDSQALLILDGGVPGTGLYTQAGAGAGADGGQIDIRVSGPLLMLGGAEIISNNLSDHAGGRVQVQAAYLSIDSGGTPGGIGSWVFGTGSGQDLSLSVDTGVRLGGAAQIISASGGPGAGPNIVIRTGSLELDGAGEVASIGSQTLAGGRGATGQIQISARNDVRLVDGGLIGSTTVTPVRAGDVTIDARTMTIDGRGSTWITGVQGISREGPTGEIRIRVSDQLSLHDGGTIRSSGSGSSDQGALRLQAGSLVADGGPGGVASISSLTTGSAASADLDIQVGDRLLLTRGGQISTGTLGAGAAGNIRVQAPTLDAHGAAGTVTGILSSSLLADAGATGDVRIDVGTLSLRSGARLSSATLSQGRSAGLVQVQVDTLTVDGQGVATGIESFAYGETGDAGRVQVDARQQITIRDGGSIVAGTLGQGSAGTIELRTPQLLIDGRGATTTYTGIGGDALGAGAGAAVNVEATRIQIHEGGLISTATSTAAPAGALRVVAETLTIEGGGDGGAATGISADSSGTGDAGRVDVRAGRLVISHGAYVSSSALDAGQGGAITIDAGQLTLDHSGAIFTIAAGSGNAGSIALQVAGELLLTRGGSIVANTGGSGAAGRIDVHAGSVRIEGVDPANGQRSRISSRTFPASGGQPGSLTINAVGALELRDGALLSIANDALVTDPAALQPTQLSLQGASISACDSDITAAASANAPAGSILLTTPGALRLDRSTVRTSALDGDGGAITLAAGGRVALRDTRITTSVDGSNAGNGGDIRITGQALLLQSGFVQANTLAPRARGGDVQVAVDLLVPDGSHVVLGGSRIEDFRPGVPGLNVIQAAAPEGLSGTLAVTLPQLNLSGSLAGLATPRIDFGPLGRDLCDVSGASSFSVQGRGALTEPAAGPLRIRP